MIITAFDPGTNESGWCTIDTRGGAGTPITATYLDAGNVPSTPGELALVVQTQRPDVVAVENLAGFAYGTKGPGVVAALISSAHAAGLIVAVAWAAGVPVVQLTARDWRTLVLGNGSATDQRIAQVIPALVHGWPTRSNVHTRDAGGLALGTAWKLNGKAPRALDGTQRITQ